MSFILLGILNSQAAGAVGAGDYDLLETTVLGSTTSSVSFTGLDSYTDYKHLQIRVVGRTDRASTTDTLLGQFNGDTSTIYSRHYMRANGSSIASVGLSSLNAMDCGQQAGATAGSDVFGASVIDILDFASSSKNTTLKAFGGQTGASTFVQISSGGYFSTSAITSIQFFPANGDFVTGSRFSLYGIKAA